MASRTDDFEIDSGTDAENSSELIVQNDGLFAVRIPSGWTPAGFFLESRIRKGEGFKTYNVIDHDGETKYPIYVKAADVSADEDYAFEVPVTGVYSIRVCSGAPGAKVAQLADRIIIPSWRRVV